MEKYSISGQAADDNTERMRIPIWINKAVDTRWEYAKFPAFPRQNYYANAPSCYVYMYIDCLCSALCYHHQSTVSLTCPQPLQGRVLYRVRSIASSFNFQ